MNAVLTCPISADGSAGPGTQMSVQVAQGNKGDAADPAYDPDSLWTVVDSEGTDGSWNRTGGQTGPWSSELSDPKEMPSPRAPVGDRIMQSGKQGLKQGLRDVTRGLQKVKQTLPPEWQQEKQPLPVVSSPRG